MKVVAAGPLPIGVALRCQTQRVSPATGSQLAAFGAAPGGVKSAAFAPAGALLLVGTYTNDLQLYELPGGKLMRAWPAREGPVGAVAAP